MKNSILNKIITEEILKEYHHSYDNGLIKNVENIITLIKKKSYDDTFQSFSYVIKSLNKERIAVTPTESDITSIDCFGNILYIPKSELNNDNRLAQLIYHELGHLTNVVKADTSQQIKKEYRPPLLLSYDDETYNRISKTLYRFNTRELKARCFETKMFLMKNKNATLKDVYDNRCSDLTLMGDFIKELEAIYNEGEESKDFSLLNSVSSEIWKNDSNSNRFYSDKDYYKNYEKRKGFKLKRARKAISILKKKYEWLKTRVNKMFYDYTIGNLKEGKISKTITEEINEFVHAVIGKDEWIPIYRVGDLDFNGFGFYFAFDEEYYDYTDTGYKFKDAKKYLLNMNARIWDPLKEAEWVDQISWADIRLPKDFCDKYDIYYEDLSEDENKPDCMTSTDDIVAAGKALGYQAVIIREIPQIQRPYDLNGDNYFDEICIFDTSIIKKYD